MERAAIVTDAEVTGYINDSIAEFQDILIANYGEDWASTGMTFMSVTASVGSYTLPTDCQKVRAVDVLVAGSSGSAVATWQALDNVSFENRNVIDPWSYDTPVGSRFGYHLMGASTMMLLPTPQASATLRLYYIPTSTLLTGSGDTLDGINGFDEYVVIDAAIKCRDKAQMEVGVLVARRENMLERVKKMSSNRVIGSVPTIRDTRGGWLTTGRWNNGYGWRR